MGVDWLVKVLLLVLVVTCIVLGVLFVTPFRGGTFRGGTGCTQPGGRHLGASSRHAHKFTEL